MRELIANYVVVSVDEQTVIEEIYRVLYANGLARPDLVEEMFNGVMGVLPKALIVGVELEENDD